MKTNEKPKGKDGMAVLKVGTVYRDMAKAAARKRRQLMRVFIEDAISNAAKGEK